MDNIHARNQVLMTNALSISQTTAGPLLASLLHQSVGDPTSLRHLKNLADAKLQMMSTTVQLIPWLPEPLTSC